MLQVQKTVFISYRRTNIYTARAVYENLKANGYDVFLDYENIDSGAFDRVILRQIEARAHFIIILTPSALERCNDPGDWLRREIEHAIDHKRNIVPLMFDNFDFRAASPYLTGKLSLVSTYNALKIPEDYFNEAMERLRTRFLNIPLEMVLHPTPAADQPIVDRKIAKVDTTPAPTDGQLRAEDYYERGKQAHDEKDFTLAIAYYSEAICLNPNYADAYVYRGITRKNKGDYDSAIADYSEAIRLNPKDAAAYNNRGNARKNKGDYDGAIADYEITLRIDPNFELAKKNLELARKKKSEQ